MEDVLISKIRQLIAGDELPADPDLLAAIDDLGLAFQTNAGMVALTETIDLLDTATIERELGADSRRVAAGIEVVWEIDSTNTWLLDRARSGAVFHGVVCMAERQTAGRGRRGRHWVSPFGRNIYLSIGWVLQAGGAGPAGLSLVVGMVVVDVLRRVGAKGAGLKWPNDVLLGGGKLAGILVEIGPGNRDYATVVIGIGINLGLTARDVAKIDQSFSLLGDITCSRNELAALLIDGLFQELGRFQNTGFAPYAGRWQHFDCYRDEPVTVTLPASAVHGINRGIDGDGNLLVETASGIQSFNAGEVSLRPGAASA